MDTGVDGVDFYVVVAAPIVGTTSVENLMDIVGALKITLSAEEIKSLEEPYKAQPIAGHV